MNYKLLIINYHEFLRLTKKILDWRLEIVYGKNKPLNSFMGIIYKVRRGLHSNWIYHNLCNQKKGLAIDCFNN